MHEAGWYAAGSKACMSAGNASKKGDRCIPREGCGPAQAGTPVSGMSRWAAGPSPRRCRLVSAGETAWAVAALPLLHYLHPPEKMGLDDVSAGVL